MTAVGGLVRYHGSITEAHGRYRLAGTCTCHDCDTDRDVWDILARNHQASPRMFPPPGPEPFRYVLTPAGPDDVRNRLEHVRPESFTTTTT